MCICIILFGFEVFSACRNCWTARPCTVHYESEYSTKLHWKILNLNIAICCLYFHFGVRWSINFYTSCDDTMFKALYNWFYPDKMFTHLRKYRSLVTVGWVYNRKGRLAFCHRLTTTFHVFSQKIYLLNFLRCAAQSLFFFLHNMHCVL
jgi:hypothetical protein